jgi:hypothetical protein
MPDSDQREGRQARKLGVGVGVGVSIGTNLFSQSVTRALDLNEGGQRRAGGRMSFDRVLPYRTKGTVLRIMSGWRDALQRSAALSLRKFGCGRSPRLSGVFG